MARFDKLRDALKLAGAARDLAVEKRRYSWDVTPPATFYLQAEHAEIRLSPHDKLRIDATIELRGGFAWQLATEKDDAGVYIVVRRKAVLGTLARLRIHAHLPPGLTISLKLHNCQLRLDDLHGELDFPPDLYESR